MPPDFLLSLSSSILPASTPGMLKKCAHQSTPSQGGLFTRAQRSTETCMSSVAGLALPLGKVWKLPQPANSSLMEEPRDGHARQSEAKHPQEPYLWRQNIARASISQRRRPSFLRGGKRKGIFSEARVGWRSLRAAYDTKRHADRLKKDDTVYPAPCCAAVHPT